MRKITDTTARIEDSLLVILLSAMIILASSQIMLRNLFDYGLLWAEPLLRIMVLWLGLIGATVASRSNDHIKIDLFSRFLSNRTNLKIQATVSLFTATVCLLIAWYGSQWVRLEYLDGMLGFANTPTWLLQVVIPLSFTVIGIRYGLMAVGISRYFYRRHCLRRDAKT